jgi:hypothetical protein
MSGHPSHLSTEHVVARHGDVQNQGYVCRLASLAHACMGAH